MLYIFLLGTAIECSTRRLRLINGTFTVTLSSYGGIVTYVCFDGYILTGPRTRTCSKDGKWEPRINPFCTGTKRNMVCRVTLILTSISDTDVSAVLINS